MNTPIHASSGVGAGDLPAHDHVFLGEGHRHNEHRVWLVIALTAATMVVEIVAGTVLGSMALVADGWHMSTHAGAMLITALAYAYARRHARDERFTFGTGKLGDLAGFASAVVLALVALLIGWESVLRLLDPVPIAYGQAIAVATIGLAVNLVSAWLLRDEHAHHHHHHHHGHDHGHHHEAGHGNEGGHARDNNLRAAYLHVIADALTSVLAIVALLLGRSQGWQWADPAMGVVGALVIALVVGADPRCGPGAAGRGARRRGGAPGDQRGARAHRRHHHRPARVAGWPGPLRGHRVAGVAGAQGGAGLQGAAGAHPRVVARDPGGRAVAGRLSNTGRKLIRGQSSVRSRAPMSRA